MQGTNFPVKHVILYFDTPTPNHHSACARRRPNVGFLWKKDGSFLFVKLISLWGRFLNKFTMAVSGQNCGLGACDRDDCLSPVKQIFPALIMALLLFSQVSSLF